MGKKPQISVQKEGKSKTSLRKKMAPELPMNQNLTPVPIQNRIPVRATRARSMPKIRAVWHQKQCHNQALLVLTKVRLMTRREMMCLPRLQISEY